MVTMQSDDNCPSCGGKGIVSVSVVHPTNPLCDTWDSRVCRCVKAVPSPPIGSSSDPGTASADVTPQRQ